MGLPGVGYDVGSKFTRGGISVAAVILVCFGLTRERSEALINERLEHETNRRNDEEERLRERLCYRSKRASFWASFHI